MAGVQIDWKPRAPKCVEWHRPVRWLHFGMALTISLELLSSLAMSSPASYTITPIGLDIFHAHEYLGIFAAVIVALHWLWMPFDRHNLIKHLFPWDVRSRREIAADLRALTRGELPAEGDRGGLSGLVHGFGLLAATAMGITGVLLYFLLQNPMLMPVYLYRATILLHAFIGDLMWVYLGGHALLAALHHFIGHPTLRRMFSW